MSICHLWAQDDSEEVDCTENCILTNDPTLQPIIRVIANPEKFNGQVVTVKGYYLKGTHINHLFLDKDSCLGLDNVNAIGLDQTFKGEDYAPCMRTSARGKLIYSEDNRHLHSDTDLALEDTVFSDYEE